MPKGLDVDGICPVGTKLKRFTPVLALYETSKKAFKVFRNKQSENCTVEGIVVTSGSGKDNPT